MSGQHSTSVGVVRSKPRSISRKSRLTAVSLYPLALQDTLRRIKLRDFENHIRRPTLLDLRGIGEPVFRLSEYHEELPAAFRLRVFQVLAQLFVSVLIPVVEDLLVLAAFEAVLPTGVDHVAFTPSGPAPLRILWPYSEMFKALGMSVFLHFDLGGLTLLPLSGLDRIVKPKSDTRKGGP
jgi:hypothetical protein